MATPQLDRRAYLRLILLGAAVGVPSAVVAAVFLAGVDDLQHWLWHDLPQHLGHNAPPWYFVLGLPAFGGLVVVAARRWLPGDGGHPPLQGIGGPPVPPSAGASVALAALGTLAFGAVLGPEGPLIALGSVIALSLTLAFKLRPQESAVLGTAGSMAAISALFGGPLVGAMMMLEGGIGLGAAILPVLLPGFVAAATGYVVFLGFGDWGGLGTKSISVPNLPELTSAPIADLFLAVVVGLAAALLITAVRRLATFVTRGERDWLVFLIPVGGLAVGCIAELADLLGAHSQDVLFSGQASVPTLVTETSAWIVLLLLVAKGLAYAISLGCGFRGGPVFPAIFLGVALATFTEIAFNVSSTAAVAIGAAAGMAAMTRLLITPVLFATLLVGRAGIDAGPAAVIAASSAWIAMRALDPPADQPAESVAS